MAARAGAGARRSDRRPAGGPGQLQLSSTSTRRTCATRPGSAAAAFSTSAATRSSRSRFLFGAEPRRVIGHDRARSRTSRSTAWLRCLLEFPGGQALSSARTQLVPYQTHADLRHQGPDRDRDPVQRAARPALPDLGRRRQPARRRLGADGELRDRATSTRCRATPSPRAIRTGAPLEFPLEDAVNNMRVLDAIFRSGASGRFEEV